MEFAALIAAFVLAAFLRNRWQRRRIFAIVIPAALVPLAITFDSFVYPASPEVQMWWLIAVITGAFYGLVAAGLGYACSAFFAKQRGA